MPALRHRPHVINNLDMRAATACTYDLREQHQCRGSGGGDARREKRRHFSTVLLQQHLVLFELHRIGHGRGDGKKLTLDEQSSRSIFRWSAGARLAWTPDQIQTRLDPIVPAERRRGGRNLLQLG